jgi:hypothetical protein
MKDNIDDRMRYKGTQLTGVMPDVGGALDNLANTYVQFFNSFDKVERLKLLGNLRLAAIDCAYKTKTLIEFFGGEVLENPLPSISLDLSRRVEKSIDGNLHGAYLNLTQLAKRFVGIHANPFVQPEKKHPQEMAQDLVQFLFQIYIVSNHIAELSIITSAEPEKGLIQ